jgi:hypothetical protein
VVRHKGLTLIGGLATNTPIACTVAALWTTCKQTHDCPMPQSGKLQQVYMHPGYQPLSRLLIR